MTTKLFLSNRSALAFETISPQPDFDVEAYIRDLDAVPHFQGDARLIGATPACLKPALAKIAIPPEPAVHALPEIAVDTVPVPSDTTTKPSPDPALDNVGEKLTSVALANVSQQALPLAHDDLDHASAPPLKRVRFAKLAFDGSDGEDWPRKIARDKTM